MNVTALLDLCSPRTLAMLIADLVAFSQRGMTMNVTALLDLCSPRTLAMLIADLDDGETTPDEDAVISYAWGILKATVKDSVKAAEMVSKAKAKEITWGNR